MLLVVVMKVSLAFVLIRQAGFRIPQKDPALADQKNRAVTMVHVELAHVVRSSVLLNSLMTKEVFSLHVRILHHCHG